MTKQRSTMASRITAEMAVDGYTLIGRTSGWFSFRKGSNLSKRIESLGETVASVKVRSAARAGRNMNDGYQLLIFKKA